MSPGDIECPSGVYTDRTVRYVDFTDTRSCDCGCEAEPDCAPGTVTLDVVPLDGGPSQQVIVADGTCNDTDFFAFIESGTYTPGDPIATCTPEGGLNGQVEVADPVTFCCD